MEKHTSHRLTVGGLLISLGIIFGDIGTSPLYVMKAINGEGNPIDPHMVMGAVSCVFWTLTLQTTIKYVILTLQADNNGEGGIFSLYTLVRKSFRKNKWLIIPAVIGGATLLADGMITPPISVTSAVEGLQIIYPEIAVIPIVLVILSILFFFQRFGTNIVGNFFGPVMLVWFTMLAVLGLDEIVEYPAILSALSPHYAINLLVSHPEGFGFLGAVFLCTTGAEALYSDLGHCGKHNIRVSWIFVKLCLIFNYLGQAGWMIRHHGEALSENPFYAIMPDWFVFPGVLLATAAAIIASQALISGSFTLISEAIRLSFYPKVIVKYPSDIKGQMYIPSLNMLLWIGCCGVVLYFKNSAHMEAAYGLSITVTMIVTTVMMGFFLKKKRANIILIVLFLVVYLSIEGTFLASNLLKFSHGGYVTLIIAGLIIMVMWIWIRAHQIKKTLLNQSLIEKYVPQFVQLSEDDRIPYYSTHLVYLSAARKDDYIEDNILYSILERFPKRAMLYWFVHVEVTDAPYTMEYRVKKFAENDLYKVTFRLGFRIEQRISYFLRWVIEEMRDNNEIDVLQTYHLAGSKLLGDFRFVIVEDVLSHENSLPLMDRMVMDVYFLVKQVSGTPEKWFGLDNTITIIEKIPLKLNRNQEVTLHRVTPDM